jgi:peptide/nickel transport system permease protein
MFGYIVRRVISGLLVLIVVSMAVFALFFYGPADPAQAYCPETRCTPARLAAIRTQLGLDRPVVEQYGEYMKGIVAGNDFQAGSISIPCPAPCLGVSFKLRVNVTNYLLGRFPATLSLALGGAAIFLLLGVSSGIFAARRRGTLADKGIVSVALVINAIPYYLVALLAYLLLISQWGVFPESGYHGLFSPQAAFASAGYLWGFVVAASVVGALARRGWDRSLRSAISAMFVGEVILYAAGVPWLMAALDVPLQKALELGLYPFVIGDTIKLLLAAGLLPAAWHLLRRRY